MCRMMRGIFSGRFKCRGKGVAERRIAYACSASITCVELLGITGRSGFIFETRYYKHCGPLDLRRSQLVLESRWSILGVGLVRG
jgi:hypothetical protein